MYTIENNLGPFYYILLLACGLFDIVSLLLAHFLAHLADLANSLAPFSYFDPFSAILAHFQPFWPILTHFEQMRAHWELFVPIVL